jgi:hypothetical protein
MHHEIIARAILNVTSTTTTNTTLLVIRALSSHPCGAGLHSYFLEYLFFTTQCCLEQVYAPCAFALHWQLHAQPS